jgi:hypothetical protein
LEGIVKGISGTAGICHREKPEVTVNRKILGENQVYLRTSSMVVLPS